MRMPLSRVKKGSLRLRSVRCAAFNMATGKKFLLNVVRIASNSYALIYEKRVGLSLVTVWSCGLSSSSSSRQHTRFCWMIYDDGAPRWMGKRARSAGRDNLFLFIFERGARSAKPGKTQSKWLISRIIPRGRTNGAGELIAFEWKAENMENPFRRP